MSTSYLLLHGLGGSGPEHWQTWLSTQLVERGQRVYYPQFPDHDEPSLAIWLQELSELMDAIPQDEVQGFALSNQEAEQLKSEAGDDEVSGFLFRRIHPTAPSTGELDYPDGTPARPTTTIRRPRPPRIS